MLVADLRLPRAPRPVSSGVHATKRARGWLAGSPSDEISYRLSMSFTSCMRSPVTIQSVVIVAYVAVEVYPLGVGPMASTARALL